MGSGAILKSLIFFTVMSLMGRGASASSSRSEQYCAFVGNQKDILMQENTQGFFQGDDYVISFVAVEVDCLDGVAKVRPTKLKFVSAIDNDYSHTQNSEGQVSDFRIVPVVSTQRNSLQHLVVTIRFPQGREQMFAGPQNQRREFFVQIGFLWKVYGGILVINKARPERPRVDRLRAN
jgi:hypothetical protein